MAEYRRTTFVLAGIMFALLLAALFRPDAYAALFGFTPSYTENGR